MSRIISSPVIAEDAQNALQDAFIALRLSSPLASHSVTGPQKSPRLELSDPLVSRRRHSEWVPTSKTVQSSPPVVERRATLSELWADPNALYTMTCLEGQFVKVMGLNPSRLTIDDFEQLYRAKFRELNEEIIRENLGFVEAMQAYERDYQDYQERMQRLRMQQMRQHMDSGEDHRQSQDSLDSRYSGTPAQGAYIYNSSTPLEPLTVEPNHKSNPFSGMAVEYPSVQLHGQTHWSPGKLVASEVTQQEQPALRSSSWTSPVPYSPITADRHSRPRGSSHTDYSRHIVDESALVYYSTPPHGSSTNFDKGELRFHGYQTVEPALPVHSGQTDLQENPARP